MTTYILLRSNKESGPFTLDQLREMGLRSDDLVWVEGQSASWRNPHEINELRELAGTATLAPAQPNLVKVSEASKAEVSAGSSTKQEKRSVFVALPSALSSREAAPVPKEEKPSYQAPAEKPKEEIETKYVMSLDEIKERYVKSLGDRRTPRRPFKLKIPPAVSRVAVYAGLIGLGAMIVLLLTRKDPVADIAREQKRLPGGLQTRSISDSADLTDNDPDVVLPESYYDGQSSIGATTEALNTGSNAKKSKVQKTRVEKSEPAPRDEVTDISREEDHRISIPQDEKPEIISTPPADLARKVSVKTNSYTIAALGGIRNLELTLRNDSRYMLNRVTVEVRFLNPNGNIVKTQDVHFSDIQPNGTQTISMKKTTRGVKVTYRIIRIESKEMTEDTAVL